MKRFLLFFFLSVQFASGAVVERWFATAAAGAGDGTSHANRAALFSAGNWSTVLTGFNFAGSDSMKAYIEAGTYTITAALAGGSFTNAPTPANPLIFVGADTSGNQLSIPDPSWTSAQAAWSTSTLPTLNTTTNIVTINLTTGSAVHCYLINFTASGRTGGQVLSIGGGLFWCQVTNSAANTLASAVTNVTQVYGSVLSCTGSSYDAIFAPVTADRHVSNSRFIGVTGSSGNRRGIVGTINNTFDLITVINCGGEGIIYTGASASQNVKISRSVIANNGGAGLKANSTASQTLGYDTSGCMITGNGAAGIDGNSNAARWLVQHNRLRNNSGGDITGLGNYPTNLDNTTTAGSDATEYVDATNGDFRIRYGSVYWGKGYGVQDQPSGVGFMIQ